MTTSVIEKPKVQPVVGDILYSSWGYDQTNIEFFKVVKVSDYSVWIQQVGSQITEITGWAHEKVIPTDSSEYQVRIWEKPGEYETKTYPIKRHKIQSWSEGYGVNLNSFSSAWIWDGKPKSASHTC
jgi:hypothetical protein